MFARLQRFLEFDIRSLASVELPLSHYFACGIACNRYASTSVVRFRLNELLVL